MGHTPPPDKVRRKILYIDDDPINRSLVSRLLTSYNFKVLEAENGLEGIAIARKELPDLILMDINMPGLDGHETTTRMCSIPSLEQIPIVAVTVRTTKGERELALAAGCDGYIPKPIDVDAFPQQVISYLEGYRETIAKDELSHYLSHYSRKLVEHLERKIIELEEANKKLQNIDKLKADFITLAAHELRTPIALVYGYAHLLQSATNETDLEASNDISINDLANKIFDSVQRLTEVVNDILNISLIKADKMHIIQKPVNLAVVIDKALEELNPAKNGRNLNITLANLETLPTITGDRQRLKQVFSNLLSNAIKFTPDGGSILVKGWTVDSFPALPNWTSLPTTYSSQQEQGVVISIKDSGIGIAPADQKQIFEHFFVVGDTAYHSSSKTTFCGGGMGLGLPIAYGIIKAHGGQIWVESEGQNVETNPGSTFYVFLPHPISHP